jgi:hypothetical protein
MKLEKVELTAEEIKAFEEFMWNRRVEYPRSYEIMVMKHYVENQHTWIESYAPLRNMGLEKFTRAVFVGYKPEKTPHEKLLDLYNNLHPQDVIRRENIIKTLDILGIQIKGVNA